METFIVEGIIVFQNISTGFWALDDGKTKYRIKNTPDELKEEGLKISATVQEIDEMSIFMSGIAIEIINFKRLN